MYIAINIDIDESISENCLSFSSQLILKRLLKYSLLVAIQWSYKQTYCKCSFKLMFQNQNASNLARTDIKLSRCRYVE